MPIERDFLDMRDAYLSVAPDPDHFEAFAAKSSAALDAWTGWPAADLATISAPTLLVVGDTDFVRLEHAVEMRGLIGGARLAVLPATTHMGLLRRADLLVPIVESFLPAAD